MKALMGLDCFEFHKNGHNEKLDGSWQRTTLHMIFDVKQDLTTKARLVAGGHLVDIMNIKCFHRPSNLLVYNCSMSCHIRIV